MGSRGTYLGVKAAGASIYSILSSAGLRMSGATVLLNMLCIVLRDNFTVYFIPENTSTILLIEINLR